MKQRTIMKSIMQILLGIIFALAFVVGFMPTTKLNANAATLRKVGDYEIVVPGNVTLSGVDKTTKVTEMLDAMSELGEDGKTTWYVITKNTATTVTVKGDVNLIVCDGTNNSISFDSSEGCQLTVWGQSENSGTLRGYYSSSQFRMYNAPVIVNGATLRYGLSTGHSNCFNCGSLTMNGGIVIPVAHTYCGIAISSGTFNFNGGTFEVSFEGRSDDFFGGETLNIASTATVVAGANEEGATELTGVGSWKTTLNDRTLRYIKITGATDEIVESSNENDGTKKMYSGATLAIVTTSVAVPVGALAFCAGFFKDAIAKFCVRLFKKKS